MKKKCTNSSCRKVFSVPSAGTVACPHCGKEYKRFFGNPHARWAVYVTGISSDSRMPFYKFIRNFMDCDFHQGLELTRQAAAGEKLLIKNDLSTLEAEDLGKKLSACGCRVKLAIMK